MRIINGLDLGSSTIRLATAALENDGSLRLLWVESLVSDGIVSGSVVDMNAALDDIDELIGRMRRRVSSKIKHVVLSINGSGLESSQGSGMIAIGPKPRQIWQRDLDRCVKVAGMIKLPDGMQKIDQMVQGYYINEGESVQDPVGLFATKLGVKLFIVSAETAKIKNLYHCVEKLGLVVDAVVPSPNAIIESVIPGISDDTKIALLDIGSHLTNMAVYEGRFLKFIDFLRKGTGSLVTPEDVTTYFTLLKNMLSGKEFSKVILAGGGALKDDMIETAEGLFGVPCELGRVRLGWCDLNASDAIIHAVSLGLIVCESKRLLKKKKMHNPLSRAARFVNNLLEEYF